MFIPAYSRQFKKDRKKIHDSNRSPELLDNTLKRLIRGEILPPRYKDHKLSGNWGECRECHIQGDWLLIYQIDQDRITFVRTGSHSELYG